MKKTSIILVIIILMFSLFGCQSEELPEGFENRKLYNDLVYILKTVKSDVDNMELTHSLIPEDYEQDDFLQKLDTYKNKNLTEVEEKSLYLGMDILLQLDLYITTQDSISETVLAESVEELMKLMELNIEL